MIETFIIALHFLSTLFNFGFSFLILKYSTRRLFHLFLTAIAFFSGIYTLSIFLSYVTQNPFWARFDNIGYFIPFFFVLFTLALKKTSHLKIKALFYFLPLPFIIYFALFTNLVIKEINLKVFPSEIVVGPMDFLGRIYLIILLIIGISNLVKIYQRSQGFQKTQLKYFLLGAVIYTLGGLIFTAIFPLLASKNPNIWFIAELSVFGSIFWVGLSSYAVLRYRLFDIGVVIGKVVIYLFSLFTIIAAGFLIAFLNNKLSTPLPYNVIVPFLGVISILLFQLTKFYEKLAGQCFYPTFYNTQIAIADLEERLKRVLELETLSSLIIETLINTFKIEKIGILTKQVGQENYNVQKTIGFKENNLISLIENEILVQCLEKVRKPLMRRELILVVEKVKEEEKEKFKKLQQKIEEIGINVCLPLVFEKEVIGIIILGDKTSKGAFTSEELELLGTFSNQASIALKNATLYSDLKDRKEELERFYRLTVGRELKMWELKEKIKELEEKLKEKRERNST